MELEVLVIGAKQYSFTNRDTGEKIEGTKVTYIDLQQDQTGNGYDVASATMGFNDISQFTKLPGVYKAVLGMTVSGGRLRTKIESFKLVSAYSFAVKS